MTERVDVAIIGGGYYGHAAAYDIKAARPDLDVVVLERESTSFSRASSTNQGQLHAGYMYSKYPDLARECAEGAMRFKELYGTAVMSKVTTFYGVHQNSDILPAEYEAFANDVELPLHRVAHPTSRLFGSALRAVYETEEKTFNNAILQRLLTEQLQASGAKLITSFDVQNIESEENSLIVQSTDGRRIKARSVCNATFADINSIHERSNLPKVPLEHAVFLHFGVRLPEEYRNEGLIVVRGMYSALAPAGEGAGDISHIFASGQFRIVAASRIDPPSEHVTEQEITRRYHEAADEAKAYIPIIQEAKLVKHIIGTRSNYIDPDTGVAASKAVVLEHYGGLRNYHVIFGGKVSCLFEITDSLKRLAHDL